ncbi:HAD-IIIC family phosphatase [Mycobacterium sp. Dal123C01]|uniref:HAD-IIIC family phosphatase n=1 Tax=Mycobacterium sp. Dal123C01 TaxID=3457577 RepID=UPI00403E5C99
MKEVVFGELARTVITLPTEVAGAFAATQAALAMRSAIIWGEHCSECAFPSCYSSCEFYTPRIDLHCRRFTGGIEAVEVGNFPALAGLTRIAFRRWGKLEGSGPAAMQAMKTVHVREQRAAQFDALMAALHMPRAIGLRLAIRLNQRRKAAASRVSDMAKDEVFIVEAYLEKPTGMSLTLSMMPWDKTIHGLFQTRIALRQGYNRAVIPATAIAATTPVNVPFAIQLEVVGEVPNQPVIFGLVDFATLNAPLAQLTGRGAGSSNNALKAKASTAKCVVWDLDNTVWRGTLVEEGVGGVVLNEAAAGAMRMLDARGILNFVASKNDKPLAEAALKHFGLDEYVLYPQVGWGPKSDAVRRIAELVDIGLDTFVFVDDEAFERGEVLAAHPNVTVMTPDDIAGFATHPLFDVPVTEESKKRASMYRDAEMRHHTANSTGTDYLGFLRSCDIVVEIMPVTGGSAERVYELTQRTNQLNVTGTGFTREQVRAFIDGDTTREGYVLRCRDNFGAYGIIGFCVLEPDSVTIEAFFMSCRVQRKRLEHSFFHWLAARLLARGARELAIAYRQTAKNAAAVQMFNELGFALWESAPGEGHFTRALADTWTDADVVRIEEVAE